MRMRAHARCWPASPVAGAVYAGETSQGFPVEVPVSEDGRLAGPIAYTYTSVCNGEATESEIELGPFPIERTTVTNGLTPDKGVALEVTFHRTASSPARRRSPSRSTRARTCCEAYSLSFSARAR
jgi:hypothetical protein